MPCPLEYIDVSQTLFELVLVMNPASVQKPETLSHSVPCSFHDKFFTGHHITPPSLPKCIKLKGKWY
jgi:hypothetical protein